MSAAEASKHPRRKVIFAFDRFYLIPVKPGFQRIAVQQFNDFEGPFDSFSL